VSVKVGGRSLGPPTILLVIAIVLFALSAIGVHVGSLSLTDFGLALFALAFAVDRLQS
jgi:hypothetical protein